MTRDLLLDDDLGPRAVAQARVCRRSNTVLLVDYLAEVLLLVLVVATAAAALAGAGPP